ncbi:MAG: GGDEF domain-containing protein [Pseudomonadota bacterium]
MANSNQALRVGVLINTLDGYFQRAVLDGLQFKAQQEGLKLLFIAGHSINAPFLFERQFNIVYDLGDNPHIDAVISATAYFQSDLTREESIRFINRFSHLPTINLNFEMPGCSSVMIDNRTGFRELMHHLIHDHGYKHFAFMKGSEGTIDANERFDVYRRCLAEAGLTYDPRLVVQGNFNQYDGRNAMEELLDRRLPFDVLVSANDGMAQVAMAVAVERGLRIPQDFALTGFDDLLSLSKEGPSLTTINQPIRQQAEMAFDVLLAKIRGEHVPHITTLPTRMVIRQSCGCIANFHIGHSPSSAAGAGAGQNSHEKIITSLQLTPEQIPQYRDYLTQLELALQGDEQGFEDCLSKIAHSCLMQAGDISHLQAMLLSMYHHLAGVSEFSREALQRFGEYLLGGQIVLSNAQSVFNVRETLLEDSNDWIRRELGFLNKRMSGFNHQKLMDLIEQSLQEFGIPTAFIALYSAPTIFESLNEHSLPGASHLIFAMRDSVRLEDDLNKPFPTRNLVPAGLFNDQAHQTLALFPIFQHTEHYGYIIFDLTVMPSVRLELIRDEISTCLISSILVAELAQARDMLKMDLDTAARLNERLVHLAGRDELTGLYNRRGFFSLAEQQIVAGKGFPMIIIFADLDGLKIINDNFGHIEGDFAIRKAGQLLAQIFRTTDIVCRLGGDEFVILSPECTPDDLLSIKRRVYKRFDAFNVKGDKPYRIACSLGYYVLEEGDKTPLEMILSRADQYLYEEKKRRKSGRDMH